MGRKAASPGKNSVDQIIVRHKTILDIIDDCRRKGRPVENSYIHAELLKRGFEITMRQLQYDRTDINTENSFLSDLGEANYSAYMQEIMDDLNVVRKEAWDKYTTTWNTKKVKEKMVKGVKVIEKELIENDAGPKARFLEIFKDVQNIKIVLLKGDNVDLAMDMLSKKLHTVKEERDGLKIQLERVKHETDSK